MKKHFGSGLKTAERRTSSAYFQVCEWYRMPKRIKMAKCLNVDTYLYLLKIDVHKYTKHTVKCTSPISLYSKF